MIKLEYNNIELNIDEETKTAYLYGTYLHHVEVWICCAQYDRIDEIETLQVMDGVTTMEPWFLSNLKGLKRLILADSISSFAEDRCFSLSQSFMGCRGLDYLKLPAGVHRLTSEIIPSAKEVFVPASITEIDKYAFSGKCKMQNIIVDDNNPEYKSVDGVLFTKNGLTLLAFPGGRTGTYQIPEFTMEIGCGAFADSEIDNVILHNNITIIGDYAFRDCHTLTEIRLPDKLRKLSSTAFEGCENLSAIECSDSCSKYRSIDNVLYTDENHEIVAVSKTITGEYDIPEGIITLGECAFFDCRITKAIIPESVRSIKWGCFCGCTELKEVVLKGNRTIPVVESGVFGGCDKLKILRYYSEDAELPSKLKFGKKPDPFKKWYDEVIYAPNVMLSQVDKAYMPTVAAGFADMILNNEEVSAFLLQNAEKYMKDHVEDLYEKAFSYIRLLEYLLYKEFIPPVHANELLKIAENYDDKRILKYLQDYVDKHPVDEDK